MNEQHRAARAADPFGTRSAASREPFDPAVLLDGRQPPPGPRVTVTIAEPVKTFDPAAFLGERALRGAFNLATVKPLITTLGGVEMVTVPAEAYADALRQMAGQVLPLETVQQTGPVPDLEGCMDLLIRLHEADVVSIGQLAQATGLDHLDLGDRIAARAAARAVAAEPAVSVVVVDEPSPVGFVPSPEEARIELPPDPVEVAVSVEDQTAAYDAAVARGDVTGSAFDPIGKPEVPAGKGDAAYDAERGGASRRRSKR